MRLTRYSDYSLRVLMYLALAGDRFATIREIAERHDISRNHLMKVVYDLGQAGYIHTVRGKNGGIQLRRDPRHINVGEVLRGTEQEPALVECFGADNQCVVTPACRLRHVLEDALEAFFAELDRYTLADLLQNGARMSTLLGLAVVVENRPPA
ncbi:MAG TPA: Rrf2 family transcriptional regulator [Arenicellales bacterium]|nr:Rrf2 family transcriptional regulator [Arenicellales bacterium]